MRMSNGVKGRKLRVRISMIKMEFLSKKSVFLTSEDMLLVIISCQSSVAEFGRERTTERGEHKPSG